MFFFFEITFCTFVCKLFFWLWNFIYKAINSWLNVKTFQKLYSDLININNTKNINYLEQGCRAHRTPGAHNLIAKNRTKNEKIEKFTRIAKVINLKTLEFIFLSPNLFMPLDVFFREINCVWKWVFLMI